MRRFGANGMISSIWRRYVVFSVLLAALVVASCAFLGIAVMLGSDTAQSWRDSAQTIAGVDSLNGDLFMVEVAVYAAIAQDRPGPIRDLEPELTGATQVANAVLASASTPAERATAYRLSTTEGDIIATWIAPGMPWGHTSGAEKSRRESLLSEQVDAGQKALLQFIAVKRGAAEAKGDAAAAARTRMLVGAAILLALALGLLVLAAVQLGRLFVKPARALEHAVSRVIGGDLDSDVPVAGPTEIASVAAKFNEMRAALKAERKREEERTEARLELAAAKQEAARLESLNIVSGGVAHEFNNLLQAIVGQAELLRAEIPERVREGFEDIERAAWKAGRLARTMLLASGQGSYVQTSVPTGEVVAALEEFAHCDVDVGFRSTEPTLTLVGDVSHLRQAVGAVVANACEAYGDDRGTVEISVECQELEAHDLARLMHSNADPGDFIVFTVEDEGEGMSPQTAARAFDPFFTTRFPGRGLGLATALGVVRGHRGAIDIASERGRGTTVRLFFPVAA
jgi:signal transduction histidine kinase